MLKSLVFLLAGATAATASAQTAAPGQPWQAGKHYFVIEPPQSPPGNGKIDVVEVFSYGCPACNSFAPIADRLKAALPANAEMRYVPASFNTAESWPLFQRAFFAAQALGIIDKAHNATFNAVWSNGPLSIRDPASGRMIKPTIEDAAKYYAQYGVSAEDFVATANSFAVNTNMKRADAWIKATGVDSTPTIVVNGKYRITGISAGSWENVIPVVQFLVQKETAGN